MDLKEKIKPFYWVEHDNGSVSLCLEAGDYKPEIFEARTDEGFEGNGYDWGSLALVFLDEKMPELKPAIEFDPEAGMFCAYSQDSAALEKFAVSFKGACEDGALISDLFTRAQLD